MLGGEVQKMSFAPEGFSPQGINLHVKQQSLTGVPSLLADAGGAADSVSSLVTCTDICVLTATAQGMPCFRLLWSANIEGYMVQFSAAA